MWVLLRPPAPLVAAVATSEGNAVLVTLFIKTTWKQAAVGSCYCLIFECHLARCFTLIVCLCHCT